MNFDFKDIPEEFSLKEIIKQDSYLVDGKLIKWQGDFSPVYSTISSTNDYKKTLLGEIPSLGKDEAIDALDSACNAFDNGKGLWPTMKVIDRIKSMERFVHEMKKKEIVVKLLMGD